MQLFSLFWIVVVLSQVLVLFRAEQEHSLCWSDHQGNFVTIMDIRISYVQLMDVAAVPALVLQLQYRYTSIIKCFLISVQDFEVDR